MLRFGGAFRIFIAHLVINFIFFSFPYGAERERESGGEECEGLPRLLLVQKLFLIEVYVQVVLADDRVNNLLEVI